MENRLAAEAATSPPQPRTIGTCKRPRHLQLSPDRKQLLVACSNDHAADVIDLATRIPLGDNPETFDISPDGKTLYVSNEDEGELTSWW